MQFNLWCHTLLWACGGMDDSIMNSCGKSLHYCENVAGRSDRNTMVAFSFISYTPLIDSVCAFLWTLRFIVWYIPVFAHRNHRAPTLVYCHGELNTV